MKTDLKTLRSYKVSFGDKKGNFSRSVYVEGYRVIFRGFQAYEFFVHHPAYHPRENHCSMWRVTEANTGVCLGKDGKTRNEAIINAFKVLREWGLEKFTKSYKKACNAIHI